MKTRQAAPNAADVETPSVKKASAKKTRTTRTAARRTVAKDDKGKVTNGKGTATTRKRTPRAAKISPVNSFDPSRRASIRELSGASGSAVSEKALKVGLLLAAIDGHCDENEIQKFRQTAQSCGELSEAKIGQIVSQTKRRVKSLEEMARGGATDSEIVAKFMSEAQKIGIDGDCRNFVLWMSIAMVDGDYSAVERLAIQGLQQYVNMKGSFLASISTFESHGRHDISDVFLKRCEMILRGIYDADACGDKKMMKNRLASLQTLVESTES